MLCVCLFGIKHDVYCNRVVEANYDIKRQYVLLATRQQTMLSCIQHLQNLLELMLFVRMPSTQLGVVSIHPHAHQEVQLMILLHGVFPSRPQKGD